MVFPCYVLKGIGWSRRTALSFFKRQQFIIFTESKYFQKFERARAPSEVLQDFKTSSRPFDTLTREGFVCSWRIYLSRTDGVKC